MNWIFFVAGRYFKSKRKNSGLTPSLLSVAGITVGVMTLVTVLAVMNGFQLGFIEDILEIKSYHIRINDPDETLDRNSVDELRGTDGIEAVIPFKEIQTMAKGFFSDFTSMSIRGISEKAGMYDSGLLSQLEMKTGDFDLSESGSIIIGDKLADQLNVAVGDSVSVVSLKGKTFSNLSSSTVDFVVKGTFECGYYQFDNSLGYISLEDAEWIMTDKEQLAWGIKIDNRFNDDIYKNRISIITGGSYDVISWRTYNSSFFGVLRTEKLTTMLLIGLIFLVVGVNIYNSLKRSVYERREEIAVLRSLGARSSGIKAVFILDGIIIGITGGVTGLILGLLLAGNINEVFLLVEGLVNFAVSIINSFLENRPGSDFALFSPAYFYIEEIPSRVLFSETLFIFVFAVISSVGAAFGSTLRVSEIKPAEILRNE